MNTSNKGTVEMTITAIKPVNELSYRQMQVKLARGRNAGYPLSIALNSPKDKMVLEVERFEGYRFLKFQLKPYLEKQGYICDMVLGEDIWLNVCYDLDSDAVCKVDYYWESVAIKHKENLLVREATLENALEAIEELLLT